MMQGGQEPTETEQDEEGTDNDTWAQTIFTVPPKVVAKLREFSPTAAIAGKHGTRLNTNDVAYGSSSPSQRQFAENSPPNDVAARETKNVENQTFLQGVPEVTVAVDYQSEASQTIYMSSPCPPLKYFRDVMTAMKDTPMPELNKSSSAQTVLTFDIETAQKDAIITLYHGITDGERDEIFREEEVQIDDFLNFILKRAFWISDLTEERAVTSRDQETQTIITFNSASNKVVLDGETQTRLTCEPSHSNTKLLADYLTTKTAIRGLVDECFARGVVPRTTVDEVIERIVANCAARIRYPTKHRSAQTLATYGVVDEDVLRKLRLPIVIDPLEASVVVVPLVDRILNDVRAIVSTNARKVSEHLVKMMCRKSATIGHKLQEIRKEVPRKSMDHLFDQRRKKIGESMKRIETESTSAQTGIAGIPEVQKIQEPRETLCSICTRHSRCRWCIAGQEGEDLPPEEIKIRRTQDILLTYKPCYVIATPSERARNFHSQQPYPKKREEKRTPLERLTAEDLNEKSSESLRDFLRPAKEVTPRDSLSGWGDVVDNVLSKPWSIQDSENNVRSGTSSENTVTTRPTSGLASNTAKTLEILKSTFCTRETCTVSSFVDGRDGTSCATSMCNRRVYALDNKESDNKEKIACYPDVCEALLNARKRVYKPYVPKKRNGRFARKIKGNILSAFSINVPSDSDS